MSQVVNELQIGEEIYKKIQGLIQFAKQNVVVLDYAEFTEEKIKEMKPVGDDIRYRMTSGNVRIVYSIEQHINGSRQNKFHHLSVSIKDTTAKPSVQTVGLIMGFFQMGKLRRAGKVWFEGPGDQCVNILVEIK